MAVTQGVTEIADSEDEPLSSSPQMMPHVDPPANAQGNTMTERSSLPIHGLPANNDQSTPKENTGISEMAHMEACDSPKPSVTDQEATVNSEVVPDNHMTASKLPNQEISVVSEQGPPSAPHSVQSTVPPHHEEASGDIITKESLDRNKAQDDNQSNPSISDLSATAKSKDLEKDAVTENDAPKGEPQTQPVQVPAASNESQVPPPSKTPQEITIDELKAQRSSLIASLAALESVQDMVAEDETSDFASKISGGEPTESDIMAAANTIVKRHIKLLHNYNEIKDMGQGLMGLIADSRGVRIVEVQEEFGVSSKD
ncbi:unnamed protein product [Periconia digitata]|uniref:Swi5-domain-containing protein n=1 Tax=Periconia digitata TaxID=1303443 RepID=A0A9W4UCP8_9PLEO|nr:unnamed protein product [Periconia digitata]